jgi:2,4-dienoyl-CoA reductase-like NADH-dependent reductase (Old Yellow Enzyme family)
MQFQALFSPLQVGPIQIKNRIQITPHELQYMEGGLATDTLINYFVERAKGGVGLSELSQLMIKPSRQIGNTIAQGDFLYKIAPK